MQRRQKPSLKKAQPVFLVCVSHKAAFKSRQQAEERMDKLNREKNRRIGNLHRAYQCELCGHWHLPSRENPNRSEI